MKLSLPSVSLICADCVNPERAKKVLDRCMSLCDFGDVKLLTHVKIDSPHCVEIVPLKSLVAYSIFMLKDLHKHFTTSHVMTVQCDGWVLNPESWKDEFLLLDFVGPLFMQVDRIGSGGCSLRSKKIMEAASRSLPEWDYTDEDAHRVQKKVGLYEDGYLSLSQFSKGFKISALDQGADFAQGGNRNPKYFREKPFAFHRTWQDINFETGYVDSSDLSRDIRPTYDDIIETF